jgi:hypothetical protein
MMRFRTARVSGHITAFIFDDCDPLYTGTGIRVIHSHDPRPVELGSAVLNQSILPKVFQDGGVQNLTISERSVTISHLGVEYEQLCALVAEATGATQMQQREYSAGSDGSGTL